MASLTCKRSNSRTGISIVVIRQTAAKSIPGSISWISNEEFKMDIDSPLKFQEKIQLVFNFETADEFRVPATVGMIKSDSKSRLCVHGAFDSKLEEQLMAELSKDINIERRTNVRKDCALRVSVQSGDMKSETSVCITNISTIGCCFESTINFNVDGLITLVFHDENDQFMTVPAIVCRVEKDDNDRFRIGCSFRSNLGILAEEHSNQSDVDWMEKITELVNSLPNF